MEKIYQIQIVLNDIKPKIWRRVLVSSDMLLSDFHKVIQSSMGWENSHLHQFIKDEKYYSQRIEGDLLWGESGDIDYNGMIISDCLKNEKDKMLYVYDLGDYWEHTIILEKILDYDLSIDYPVCTGGRTKSPPEDCGGTGGYHHMLEVLCDPQHKEYLDYRMWYSDYLNSLGFKKKEVNRLLATKNYGCSGDSYVYQIQIALKGIRPKIWRRVLVSSDMLLSDFHKVIQSSMGWLNMHLHQFIIDDVFYTLNDGADDWGEVDEVDYTGMKLSDFLACEKDKIIYEYDYGDSWEHEIILEKILNEEDVSVHPVCIKGKNYCPPENSGGAWGYMDMLKILKNPKHKDYKSFIDYYGEHFDPKEFDIDFVNELLEKEDYGCIYLEDE